MMSLVTLSQPPTQNFAIDDFYYLMGCLDVGLTIEFDSSDLASCFLLVFWGEAELEAVVEC